MGGRDGQHRGGNEEGKMEGEKKGEQTLIVGQIKERTNYRFAL